MPLARVRLDAGRPTTGCTATSRCWSPACLLPSARHRAGPRDARRRRRPMGRRARSRASSASTSPAARRASSMPGSVLRLAAATARAQLLGAASLAWKQPAGELRRRATASSATRRRPRRTTASSPRMAAATPPATCALKAPRGLEADRHRRAAHRRRRQDRRQRRVFGIDVRLPGMRLRGDPPLPDARRQPRRGRRRAGAGAAGVERVVRLGPYAGSTAALAVVGRTGWHAAARRDGARGRVAAARRPARSTRASRCARSRRARAPRRRDGGFAFHPPRRRRRRRGRRGAPHRADLPRALPRARDDGADQLHGARRRRQGRGLGADAGARPGARRSRRRSPASPRTR